jgi:hypothetical protein
MGMRHGDKKDGRKPPKKPLLLAHGLLRLLLKILDRAF